MQDMPVAVRVLVCQASDCDSILRSDNRDGYCRSHKSATSRLPRRACSAEGCDSALRVTNKSGCCSGHVEQTPNVRQRNAQKRAATASGRESRRKCSFRGCANGLRSDNTTGRCRRHAPLADRPECSMPGCTRLLIATNKTGRCQDHSALSWVAATCGAEGCGRVLRAHNLLGFCKEHTTGYNRSYTLRRNYGLTSAEYDAMLAEQRGVCAICLKPPKAGGLRAAGCLHVDHDHATGCVRELLCLNCNRGLGGFKDDPALLRKAADYVERHAILADQQARRLQLA